jgi:hypothetical protein
MENLYHRVIGQFGSIVKSYKNNIIVEVVEED